jgi:hypothetical protein
MSQTCCFQAGRPQIAICREAAVDEATGIFGLQPASK